MTLVIDAGSEKRALRRLVPGPVYELGALTKKLCVLVANYAYDFWRYAKFSSVLNRGDSAEKLRALITLRYHCIEKGLSLPRPRPGFGRADIDVLLGYLDEYMMRYGVSQHLSIPINALTAYINFNANQGGIDPILNDRILTIKRTFESELGALCPGGGVVRVTKTMIEKAVTSVGPEFFNYRFSVRQFSDEDVPVHVIEEAVRMAQKAPAVCNRQSGRVWMISDREDVQISLSIQGGANGFAETINKLLVVTSELGNFQGVGERYQSWIDGGLFAMSLIYALHSKGLGTCCLNWSKEYALDQQFKKFLGMPQSETIILVLAVGQLPAEFSVAQSCRKPLEEVFVKFTGPTMKMAEPSVQPRRGRSWLG